MAPLSVHTHASSVKGLSSVTTLVVGIKSALVFDPPFLIQDSRELVAWIKRHTTLPVKAIFITHHHPDHYFAANAVLEAFPAAKFYAAPYVCAAIDREYEEKVEYFSKHFGAEHVYAKPQKPTPFLHSLIYLEGNPESPIFLLGPLQGDCVDHTLFWMPMEKTLVCGDTVYARSTHVWVEEVETAALLEAWQKTLGVIETLSPDRLIAGHLEEGWEFDAAADLAHTRAYLKLFGEQVVYSEQQLTVDELYKVFETSFPQATANLDFFLGHMSNQFGKGGQIWEENRHHNAAARGKEELLTYFIC